MVAYVPFPLLHQQNQGCFLSLGCSPLSYHVLLPLSEQGVCIFINYVNWFTYMCVTGHLCLGDELMDFLR